MHGIFSRVVCFCNKTGLSHKLRGKMIMVHPWTDEHRVASFPFRLGYATTLHKIQGATLGHITLYLDLANMPAAAYVALSRVQMDSHWRYLGDPTRHHFTPARFD